MEEDQPAIAAPSEISAEVTREEQDRYAVLLAEAVARTEAFRHAAPDTLWHYTSAEGLIGIVKSGSLWATQVSCLNDATEMRYSARLLQSALINLRAGRTLGPDDTYLFDRMITALSRDAAALSPWFVASLSEKPDDLSQWRAYGKGEGGYAIGFYSGLLAQAGAPDQAYVFRVNYDPTVHEAIAQGVATHTVDEFLKGLAARPGISREDWAENFLASWGEMIGYLGPIAKHPAFAAEQEWRVVRMLREEDFARLEYQPRQFMISRHLPLTSLRLPATELLPIAGVVVGPSRHQDITATSVATMLRSRGYPAEVYSQVRKSEVPFQAT